MVNKSQYLLTHTIEEKLDNASEYSDTQLKRHTRWIALNGTCPIVSGLFGTYINPLCHVLDSYSQQYLEKLVK